MELKILDAKGKAKGKHTLSEQIANARVRRSVLHRVVVAEQANKRQGTHSAKTRAEVRGGGRKPYRQKKTGRARQGSIRAPHFTHGGVVHPPKPRDYSLKVNRRERRLAILGALRARVEDGDVILVNEIKFDEPKTKHAVEFLNTIGADAKRILVILPEVDDVVVKSFRNLRNDPDRRVEVRTAPASVKPGGEPVRTQAFSARDLLLAGKIIVTQEAMNRIEEVWAK